MIVINLQGGMGNQMFEYALYTKMQKTGKKVCLDYSWIMHEMKEAQRQTIFDVFRLDREYRVDLAAGWAGYLQRHVCNRIFRKLTTILREKEDGKLDPQVLQLKAGYLEGYWQTEKYFADCRQELLERFQFKGELSEANKAILQKIKAAKCPISLHIRLGDYTTATNSAMFGNICTGTYYEKAIDYFAEKYGDPTFFVFSNEPQKATEMIHVPNAVIVDVNDEMTAWADMYLMSQCHHNILANSSFSWWGAWLNENPDKEVIAPKKWLNGKQTPDICPDAWLRF